VFVFDCDRQYSKTCDTFTREIDEECRFRTVRFETGPNNENFILVDGQPCVHMPDMYPPLLSEAGVDDFFPGSEIGNTR
jgi:hypothetical protein